MTRITRALVFVLRMAVCIGCDRVTKDVATDALRDSAPVSVAGGVVRLQYAGNRGAFLGLGDDLGPRARFWRLGIGAGAMLAAVAASSRARARARGPSRR